MASYSLPCSHDVWTAANGRTKQDLTKAESNESVDAGSSIITNNKKRESIWNPLFVFGKLIRREKPDTKFTSAEIDSQWAEASEETKKQCQEIADDWIKKGPVQSDNNESNNKSNNNESINEPSDDESDNESNNPTTTNQQTTSPTATNPTTIN